jgi:hypothetical protein
MAQLLLVRAPHLNSSYFWVPPRISHKSLVLFTRSLISGASPYHIFKQRPSYSSQRAFYGFNYVCHLVRIQSGNLKEQIEVVARRAARCHESTQYSIILPRGVSLVWLLLLLWLFSKCLLGGLAIFIMADNKEQRVCVKLFCFLLWTVRNLTAAL